MRRIILFLILFLIIAAALLHYAIRVSAQPEQVAVTISGNAILPLGYACTMTVYADGKANLVPAQVQAYVIWVNRPESVEYYVSDDLNGIRYWNMLTRESLDRVCK